MNSFFRNVFLGLAAVIISGCAHVTEVNSVRATNVYSNHEGKILRTVSYTVDGTSLTMLKRDDSISGFMCSAHKFPIDAGAAFERSVPTMLDQIFNDVKNTENAGPQDIKLLFRIERFEPKLKFTQGFWSGDSSATVELGVSVVGYLNGKRVFGTSVDTQRTKDGASGAACEGGPPTLAEATQAAIKDVLEKLGERIANNSALRG